MIAPVRQVWPPPPTWLAHRSGRTKWHIEMAWRGEARQGKAGQDYFIERSRGCWY